MAEIDYGASRHHDAHRLSGATRGLSEGQRLATARARMQPMPQGQGAPEHDIGDYIPRVGLPRMQKIVNGAGALTSLALVIGLGVWGYKLAVRDVSGIPVIRALEGPARVAPENPGGEVARHQGLSVNTVAAEGEAAPAPDTLVLAPKAVELSDDDKPMMDLAAAPVPDLEAEADPVLAALTPPTDPLLSTPLDLIPQDVPGVAVSVRPARRPGGDVEADAALAAVMAALAPEAELDVDPASLPAGTRLVQLGTFPTEEAAREGWQQIAATFGPLLDGKRRVVEPAEANGEPFYRLRAEGFADLADARRFCAVLDDQGATCVPAQVR